VEMLLAARAAQSPVLPVQYNAVRFSFTFFFGLLLGTTFWRIGQDRCAHVIEFYQQKQVTHKKSKAFIIAELKILL